MTPARPVALITRPREDADALAQALWQRGYQPLIEPMLDIRFLPGPRLDRQGLQGLLATSANGVRALSARLGEELAGWRDLPLWAVGDASAAEARSLGFTRVRSADGDVAALAALVAATASPAGGRLLHMAATKLAGDLAGLLSDQGFSVEKALLYESVPADALSDELLAALDAETVTLAAFFSPRTAQGFVRLIEGQRIAKSLRGVTALALSRAVRDALASLPWLRFLVAAQPQQMALLAALDGG